MKNEIEAYNFWNICRAGDNVKVENKTATLLEVVGAVCRVRYYDNSEAIVPCSKVRRK